MTDLGEFALFAGGGILVVTAMVCAACAIAAVRFYAQDLHARRRREAQPRPLASIPDLFGDLSWEPGPRQLGPDGVADLERYRLRREDRDGC